VFIGPSGVRPLLGRLKHFRAGHVRDSQLEEQTSAVSCNDSVVRFADCCRDCEQRLLGEQTIPALQLVTGNRD
jgi:hypothetical protein